MMLEYRTLDTRSLHANVQRVILHLVTPGGAALSAFGFRISFGLRISGFGLRLRAPDSNTETDRFLSLTASSAARYPAGPNPDSDRGNRGCSAGRGFPGGAGRWRQSA